MLSIAELGARVRRLRKEQGLSGTALAEKAGMSRNTLSSFERGQGNLEMSRFLALARALKVGVELLPERALDAVSADLAGRSLTAVQRLVASRRPAARGDDADPADEASL
jgi:transcriptional regulator with XRE-family HTH domain